MPLSFHLFWPPWCKLGGRRGILLGPRRLEMLENCGESVVREWYKFDARGEGSRGLSKVSVKYIRIEMGQ